MGLIVATITRDQLRNQKSDLEYKMMLIRQSKTNLSSTVKDLLNAGTDMDPESPAMKQLEERKKRLNDLERKLDSQLAEYEVQLQQIDKNMAYANKMISSSIK